RSERNRGSYRGHGGGGRHYRFVNTLNEDDAMSAELSGLGVLDGLAYCALRHAGIDDYALFQAGQSERGVPLWEFQLLKGGRKVDSFVLELDTNALPDFESMLAREVLFPTLMDHHKQKWAR